MPFVTTNKAGRGVRTHANLPFHHFGLAETVTLGEAGRMWMELAAAAIVLAIVVLTLTAGRHGAIRAERRVGAWAWLVYITLGVGMMFGAMSISQPLLSVFMWTKLTAFILTGAWLAGGRLRRREPLFPGGQAAIAD